MPNDDFFDPLFTEKFFTLPPAKQDNAPLDFPLPTSAKTLVEFFKAPTVEEQPALYLLSQLPRELKSARYRNTYIFTETTSELFHISSSGNAEQITIHDSANFLKTLREVMGNFKRKRLNKQQADALIVENCTLESEQVIAFKQGAEKLVARLAAWCKENNVNPKPITLEDHNRNPIVLDTVDAFLNNFLDNNIRTPCIDESISETRREGFFRLYATGLHFLQSINNILYSDSISLDFRRNIADILVVGLLCGPGSYNSLQDAYLKLASDTPTTLMGIRHEIAKQVAVDVIRANGLISSAEGDLVGEETHVATKFLQNAAGILALDVADEYAPRELDEVHIEEFMENTRKTLTSEYVIEQIIAKLDIDDVSERLKKSYKALDAIEEALNNYGTDEAFNMFHLIDPENPDMEYELCLLADNVQIEKGKLYVKKVTDTLQYKVLAPSGQIVEGVVSQEELEHEIPEPLDLNTLVQLLPAILKITSQRNHTAQKLRADIKYYLTISLLHRLASSGYIELAGHTKIIAEKPVPVFTHPDHSLRLAYVTPALAEHPAGRAPFIPYCIERCLAGDTQLLALVDEDKQQQELGSELLKKLKAETTVRKSSTAWVDDTLSLLAREEVSPLLAGNIELSLDFTSLLPPDKQAAMFGILLEIEADTSIWVTSPYILAKYMMLFPIETWDGIYDNFSKDVIKSADALADFLACLRSLLTTEQQSYATNFTQNLLARRPKELGDLITSYRHLSFVLSQIPKTSYTKLITDAIDKKKLSEIAYAYPILHIIFYDVETHEARLALINKLGRERLDALIRTYAQLIKLLSNFPDNSQLAVLGVLSPTHLGDIIQNNAQLVKVLNQITINNRLAVLNLLSKDKKAVLLQNETELSQILGLIPEASRLTFINSLHQVSIEEITPTSKAAISIMAQLPEKDRYTFIKRFNSDYLETIITDELSFTAIILELPDDLQASFILAHLSATHLRDLAKSSGGGLVLVFVLDHIAEEQRLSFLRDIIGKVFFSEQVLTATNLLSILSKIPYQQRLEVLRDIFTSQQLDKVITNYPRLGQFLETLPETQRLEFLRDVIGKERMSHMLIGGEEPVIALTRQLPLSTRLEFLRDVIGYPLIANMLWLNPLLATLINELPISNRTELAIGVTTATSNHLYWNVNQLAGIMCSLPDSAITSFLGSMKVKELASIFFTGSNPLVAIFNQVSESSFLMLLGTLSDSVSSIIKDGYNLATALHTTQSGRRLEFLHCLSTFIDIIIQSGAQLITVMAELPKGGLDFLQALNKDFLAARITTDFLLRGILQPIDIASRLSFLERSIGYPRLKSLLQSGRAFQQLLESLDSKDQLLFIHQFAQCLDTKEIQKYRDNQTIYKQLEAWLPQPKSIPAQLFAPDQAPKLPQEQDRNNIVRLQ